MSSPLAKAALLITGVSALVAGPAVAAAAVPHRVGHARSASPGLGAPFIRTNGEGALPSQGGTVTSTNWSGYAVTPAGGNITAVSSTFTVPTAGLVLPGFAASWTGIGGYTSQDLIQAGVAEDSVPSNPLLGAQYFAWYELLPGASVPLTNCTGDTSCTVNPGDSVSVDIHQTADNIWTIGVADSGHWTWTASDVSYVSSHSSAEWILEAPQVDGVQSLIAGVGTAHFGPVSTFTVGSGAPMTIASGDPTQINLSTPGISTINLATTSALAPDGQSFNVCVYAQSCAAP